MSETVLILGATGRFGRAAATAFDAAGWRVRRWARPGRAGPGVGAVFEGALSDRSAVARAADGAAVVVNAMNPPYPEWAEEAPRQIEATIAAAKSSGATVLLPGNVYNFGSAPPEVMRETSPQIGDHRKAAIRIAMEERLQASGVRAIVLRAGDFIDTAPGDNWFEGQITKDVAKGRIMYPGPLDRVHAWAFLPDMARAATALAARRETLSPFQTVGFPGYAITGEALIEAVERAVGAPLARRRLPLTLLRAMGLVSPLMREVAEMAYLWRAPHRIDGALFNRLLPDFAATPLDDAVRASLEGSGRLAGAGRVAEAA